MSGYCFYLKSSIYLIQATKLDEHYFYLFPPLQYKLMMDFSSPKFIISSLNLWLCRVVSCLDGRIDKKGQWIKIFMTLRNYDCLVHYIYKSIYLVIYVLRFKWVCHCIVIVIAFVECLIWTQMWSDKAGHKNSEVYLWIN